MSDTNVSVFGGRLGQDIQLKTLPNGKGTQCAEFSVANTEAFPDGNGGFTQETSWIDVRAFGKLAERQSNRKSGDHLIITGRLVTKQWRTGDDQPRKVHFVRAEKIELARKAGSTSQPEPSGQQQSDSVPQGSYPEYQQSGGFNQFDDEPGF